VKRQGASARRAPLSVPSIFLIHNRRFLVDDAILVRAIALGRVALGLTFVVTPRAVAGFWTGDTVDRPDAVMLARGLGARDAAIGLGTLLALRAGQPLRHWLQIGAISDAADAALTVRSIVQGSRPRLGRYAIAGLAASAAVGQVLLATRIK